MPHPLRRRPKFQLTAQVSQMQPSRPLSRIPSSQKQCTDDCESHGLMLPSPVYSAHRRPKLCQRLDPIRSTKRSHPFSRMTRANTRSSSIYRPISVLFDASLGSRRPVEKGRQPVFLESEDTEIKQQIVCPREKRRLVCTSCCHADVY